MKYLKMIGLATFSAAALMALAGVGSASATVLCKESITQGCPAGKDYAAGTAIEVSATNSSKLVTSGITIDTCTGTTIRGTTANTGGTESVRTPIEEINWGTCTQPTKTIKNGELEIHWISGTDNGTLTIVGSEWTIQTIFGSCVYSASDIGTLVGGNPATIEVKEQNIKLLSGPCPSETKWTQSFAVTSPKPLYVASASASAAVLCSEVITEACGAAGKDYAAGTAIEVSATNSSKLVTSGITIDTCTGTTIRGTTANTGGTESVRTPIEEINWGTCTQPTKTIKNGELEIHWISGTDNGTLTIVGSEWTIQTIFGSCVYSASDIGTLVGGNPATIEVKEQNIKLLSGPCPSETKWTQSFAVTSPKPLYVSAS